MGDIQPRTAHESTTRGRRRWAAAAAATVAAITITGSGLLSGCGSGGGGNAPDQSADPSAVTPTSAAPSSSTAAGPFDLLSGVTEGAAPAVPYLHGATLVRPDGTTQQLPHAYDQFALIGDRILTVWAAETGDRTLQLLDAKATVLRSSPVEANFVVEPRGDLAAWATPQGELEALWPSGTLSLGNQGGPVSVAAVIGDGSCRAADGGCRIYVNNRDSRPPASVGSDGTVEAVAPRAIKVDDVVPSGQVAVQISSSNTGSCSGVYDPELDRFLWRTCQNSLFRFSPDGRYLLGSDPYLDALGLASLTVLDASTGARLVKFTIRGGFISQWGWEDDSHPLVVISGPAGWEILRLGLDGTRQRAVGPVAPATDPTLRMLTIPGSM